MNFAVAPQIATQVPLSNSVTGSSEGTKESAQHRRLTDAAQQFEGMLLQEMLKPMREHGFGQDESEDKEEGSGFGDTLSSYGTEAVATAISKGGGLGIAKRVISQVEGEKKTHEARSEGRSGSNYPDLSSQPRT